MFKSPALYIQQLEQEPIVDALVLEQTSELAIGIVGEYYNIISILTVRQIFI